MIIKLVISANTDWWVSGAAHPTPFITAFGGDMDLRYSSGYIGYRKSYDSALIDIAQSDLLSSSFCDVIDHLVIITWHDVKAWPVGEFDPVRTGV